MEGLFGGGSSEPKGPSGGKFSAYNENAGHVGERFYHRGLQTAGITDAYSVYPSRRIPTLYRQKPMDGDVDEVVAGGENGKRVLLLDVKMWEGQRIYWSVRGYGFKGGWQAAVLEKDGRPKWKLSTNMQIAVERYRAELPGDAEVYAAVVFVPAGSKNPQVPRSVRGLRWPGNIRSYFADESYDLIERVLGAPGKAREDIDRLLKGWPYK